MTVYQVEKWVSALPEMQPLWEDHFREVAAIEGAPLSVNLKTYAALEAAGMLHVLTARAGGVVVGYLTAMVMPHLHHDTTLHAFFDLYYLRPEYRRGSAGVRLFREAERTLAERGVRRIIAGTKVHAAPNGRPLDVSRIFQRLGWVEMERHFGKWIG